MKNSDLTNIVGGFVLVGYLGLTTLAGAWSGNYLKEMFYRDSKDKIEKQIMSEDTVKRESAGQDLVSLNIKYKLYPKDGYVSGGILGFLLGLGLPLLILTSHDEDDGYGYHTGHTWQ